MTNFDDFVPHTRRGDILKQLLAAGLYHSRTERIVDAILERAAACGLIDEETAYERCD